MNRSESVKNMFYNIKIRGQIPSPSVKSTIFAADLEFPKSEMNIFEQSVVEDLYEPKPNYMKFVKWIFVVLVVCSLLSFMDKEKTGSGWNLGDKAPDWELETNDGQLLQLRDLRGSYVLLSFWASYDAVSRVQNIRLGRAMERFSGRVKMLSVSFDEYQSVFDEAVRADGIEHCINLQDVHGESSSLFKDYRLNKGFKNYLLDDKGVIIAKNVTVEQLETSLP